MNNIDTVLKAIAVVETGSGINSYPRFERSYAPKGQRFTVQGHIVVGTGSNFTPIAKERWDRYGMSSACSYGPWQILYHTAADRGFGGSPWELWDRGLSAAWVTKEIHRQFHKGAYTIAKIADAWNSGSFLDANVPGEYVANVTAAFIAAGGDPLKPLML